MRENDLADTLHLVYSEVKKSFYRDSVNLMRLSSLLREMSGVQDVAVLMGTENNKRLIEDAGLMTEKVRKAEVNDICIVAKVNNEQIFFEVKSRAENYFLEGGERSSRSDDSRSVNSLDIALKNQPETNLALISTPGQYAGKEAENCLERGLNVFVFSDNVSISEEVRLKDLALIKNLLFMGPDCGSAIIGGVPIGFANNIRRGNIGIVSASGTGLQEVSTIIHKEGGGISHAIGIGGRDLSKEVQGKSALRSIALLNQDPSTSVIVLISKPPDRDVVYKILEMVEDQKPLVICFLGWEEIQGVNSSFYFAETLENAAMVAVKIARGETGDSKSNGLAQQFSNTLLARVEDLDPGRKHIRGLFTGGTLADEAAFILSGKGIKVWALHEFGSVFPLPDVHISKESTIIDLGADCFTQGRAHPMIDPRYREQRLLIEIQDKEVAVFLFDVVLGWGSHPDPGGALASAIKNAKQSLAAGLGQPLFIASVTGSDLDVQDYDEQVMKLEDEDVVVVESNAQAAMTAAHVLGILKNG